MTTLRSYSVSNTGYYKGTYNFINDANSSVPNGWTDSSGAGCTVQIISDLGGHNKVLEIDDQNNPSQCIITSDVFTGITSGTIEWWWRITTAAAGKQFMFLLSDGAYPGYTGAFCIGLRSGAMQFYDWDTGGWQAFPVATAYAANTWYHMKLIFTDANNAHIYVNGVDKGAITSDGPAVVFDRIVFYTWTTDNGYIGYIDAIGCSWDDLYSVGDNNNLYSDPVVFKHAKTIRGSHADYHDFSTFDNDKVFFPDAR